MKFPLARSDERTRTLRVVSSTRTVTVSTTADSWRYCSPKFHSQDTLSEFAATSVKLLIQSMFFSMPVLDSSAVVVLVITGY